jgi:hypothetical protein
LKNATIITMTVTPNPAYTTSDQKMSVYA